MFDKLINIRVGDKIYVKDENGNISVFVVVKSKVYGENDDASQVFHSNDGKIHLNLITCSGDWNKEKQSYSDRLVIFADRSPES
jgi:sortase (surface protein transpeptidase)